MSVYTDILSNNILIINQIYRAFPFYDKLSDRKIVLNESTLLLRTYLLKHLSKIPLM